ncbi:hypothetical protein CH330_03425 [candidate division WOR-3 bacterium JGI_Cruoil_03_51_56]|uniref:NAD-dependent protein deacylase n=1 Tax=candidate division WOR-3 bacterium JGI_Cruoil_03_51_56 TaxID=1973747 RepID=A0A235BUX4_UNCW3|nr:MAG: hypothetical protein CH330_03425 [candidate division WOR-3 bacterium JGI_Cruoil_03_51_56]
MKQDINQVREKLAKASNIMVITGAGISAESGIPTFRTGNGLWKKFNPAEYATPEAFRKDPEKVWKWYDKRRQEIAEAEPNPGHKALARLEKIGKRVFIITQNVDDLHERAGSKEVIHIHGSIWRLRCERDGTIEENREVPKTHLPLCPCGNIMRPDVVWFGEQLPWQPIEKINHYLLTDNIDICFIIGTEASFGYIVEWAFHAHEQGAMIVDINPKPTGLSNLVDIHLEAQAGQILPKILRNVC